MDQVILVQTWEMDMLKIELVANTASTADSVKIEIMGARDIGDDRCREGVSVYGVVSLDEARALIGKPVRVRVIVEAAS